MFPSRRAGLFDSYEQTVLDLGSIGSFPSRRAGLFDSYSYEISTNDILPCMFPSRRAGLSDSYKEIHTFVGCCCHPKRFHPDERDCLIPTVQIEDAQDYTVPSFPSRRAGLSDSYLYSAKARRFFSYGFHPGERDCLIPTATGCL